LLVGVLRNYLSFDNWKTPSGAIRHRKVLKVGLVAQRQ